MKLFTDKDVTPHGSLPDCGSINADRSQLLSKMLPHQKLGLNLTRSGYGAKLPSDLMINFNQKIYRIYVTSYSNNASCWFKVKGKKIFVN